MFISSFLLASIRTSPVFEIRGIRLEEVWNQSFRMYLGTSSFFAQLVCFEDLSNDFSHQFVWSYVIFGESSYTGDILNPTHSKKTSLIETQVIHQSLKKNTQPKKNKPCKANNPDKKFMINFLNFWVTILLLVFPTTELGSPCGRGPSLWLFKGLDVSNHIRRVLFPSVPGREKSTWSASYWTIDQHIQWEWYIYLHWP